MSHATPIHPGAPPVANSFALVLKTLHWAILRRPVRPATEPLVLLLCGFIGRLSRRFACLATRVAQGRATPRRRPPGPRPEPAAPRKPRQRLPSGYAWLFRLVPEAGSAGSQLQHLLNQPEMAALLEAAPQAASMLRPLCRMLAIPPGNVTTIDLRPRKRVRPPRPKPPPGSAAPDPAGVEARRRAPRRPARPRREEPPAPPPPPTPEPARPSPPTSLPRSGWVGIVSFRGEI